MLQRPSVASSSMNSSVITHHRHCCAPEFSLRLQCRDRSPYAEDIDCFRVEETTMPFPLLRLPEELIAMILLHVEPALLATCRCVCRRLHEVVTSSNVLTYRFELWAAGMEDGYTGETSVKARLDKLYLHQAAWATGRYIETEPFSLRLTAGYRQPYLISQGIIAARAGTRGLVFRQLPSVCRGIKQRDWFLADVGFDVYYFGFDTSQNLLYVVERRIHEASPDTSQFVIHLYFLDTGGRRTTPPSITIPQPVKLSVDCTVTMFGPLMAILWDDSSRRGLTVIDWTCSEFQLHCRCPGAISVSILSRDIVAVNAQTVVAQGSNTRLQAQILFYDVSALFRGEPRSPGPACILSFPHFEELLRIKSFFTDDDVAFRAPSPDYPVPFVPSGHSRMLVFRLCTDEPGRMGLAQTFDYAAAVSRSDLLARVKACNPKVTTTIPWASLASGTVGALTQSIRRDHSCKQHSIGPRSVTVGNGMLAIADWDRIRGRRLAAADRSMERAYRSTCSASRTSVQECTNRTADGAGLLSLEDARDILRSLPKDAVVTGKDAHLTVWTPLPPGIVLGDVKIMEDNIVINSVNDRQDPNHLHFRVFTF